MPITPVGQTANPGIIGGSPRGWTFISTAECWRMMALRYLVGLFHHYTKGYFDLGSAYHALMEGQPVERVAAEFPDHIEEAKRLATVRKVKGPPLPPALKVEQEYGLFSNRMTSKPDREEAAAARDYKTTFNFSKHDEKKWNVAGGIIGEALAAGRDTILVDIITKREGKGEFNEPQKPVKVITVQVTDKKVEALTAQVDDFWWQLEQRITRVAKAKNVADINAAFPPNLNRCVGSYGPCDYYEHCWGKPPESLLYRLAPVAPTRWATGRSGELKLPGKLTLKVIAKASAVLRKLWFKK